MPAMCIQMHFHGYASLFKRDVISQRIINTVHVIIFCLEQKCGRCLAGNRNFRIYAKVLVRMGGIIHGELLGAEVGYSPTSVTRYFNNTHVIPLAVSQSHTSVPSKSMARIW